MFKTSPYYIDSKTCPHWIPIEQECYACKRNKKREKHKYITVNPISPSINTISTNGYINPYSQNKVYRSRNEYNNNKIIDRQITLNQSSNIPPSNIPPSNIPPSNIPNTNFYGIDTRTKKNIDSDSLYLKRSMLLQNQNIFYENRPFSSR